MIKFTIYRQARAEISRLIKVADRYIFSVFDHGRQSWQEYGPYHFEEAKKNRKLIFLQKVQTELKKIT